MMDLFTKLLCNCVCKNELPISTCHLLSKCQKQSDNHHPSRPTDHSCRISCWSFQLKLFFFHTHKQQTVTQECNLYAPREGSITEIETFGAPKADQIEHIFMLCPGLSSPTWNRIFFCLIFIFPLLFLLFSIFYHPVLKVFFVFFSIFPWCFCFPDRSAKISPRKALGGTLNVRKCTTGDCDHYIT